MKHIVELGEGLSNALSYTHYNEVLAYAMSRYGYEWLYKNDDCVFERSEVNRASVSASDMIDSLSWVGIRSRPSQAREWPRCRAYSCCNDGYCVPSNIIPKEILDSTIILTLLILKGEIQVGTNKEDFKVKSVKLDKMSIEFQTGAYIDSSGGSCGNGMGTKSGDDFHSVRHLIDCYLKKSAKTVNAKFKRSL